MAKTTNKIHKMQQDAWDKAVEGQKLIDHDDLIRARGKDPEEVLKRALRSARARRAVQVRWDRQRNAS